MKETNVCVSTTHQTAKMQSKIVLALAMVASASAVCPNACSGHGTCGEDDVCFCYQDWGMGDENSGDCSQKFCAFE